VQKAEFVVHGGRVVRFSCRPAQTPDTIELFLFHCVFVLVILARLHNRNGKGTMPQAFRAARIITLAGEEPARTLSDLEAPLFVMRDAVLLTSRGKVTGVECHADFQRRAASAYELEDLGQVFLAPAFVNAHCHLELSHLAGKTASGGGFTAWLESLIPLLRKTPSVSEHRAAVKSALNELAGSGVAHTGDVGSRHLELVSELAGIAAEDMGRPYPLTHFLEAIGFSPSRDVAVAGGFAPPASAQMLAKRRAECAVAGHALYSTGPEALRAASYWCWERGRVFSLHLAESEEEQELLLEGGGALHDIMSRGALPERWQAPGMSAVDYAAGLHLLNPFTLAVHCVHCSSQDIERLALTGTNVCLCPRSNVYIGVGTAPARVMAEAGVLLCLGTDGLCSNENLDMQREMAAAMDIYGLSARAALRMATVNGAYALGLGHLGCLSAGKTAAFSVLGPRLAESL
jgi:cytosine/adenosine deaminase-related metal-dependent hydrolase